jgi:glycosyltransferase involved in cell wall biosynthesis
LRTLCGFAQRGGFDVQVIADRDGPLLDQLARDGVATLALPLATPRRFATSLPRLVAAIRRAAPDLLHLHGQPSGFFGSIAGRVAGVRRLVYSAQFPAFHADFDPWRRLRNGLVEWVSGRLASRVVCLSRYDCDEYLRRRLALPQRLLCIPNCVDEAFFRASPLPAPGPRPFGLPSRGPLIGFVGRLTDQKGVEDLIHAVPIVRAAHPEAHVVIAGDGPLRPALEALAQQEAMAAVTFTGALENPLPVFQLSEVVVVPSRFEPLGIVAAEALALGKPVVASRVGGLPDIIEHELTGLLIPPADPRSLAEAVCRLLGARGMAEEMGARGRDVVRHRFSEEVVLPRYLDLYREVLAEA